MDKAIFETAHLAALNDQQRAAVEAVNGPVLLLAVPGSGKTTVLITRLGYMTEVCGIAPETILTMTYTVAATQEMRARFAARFGGELAARLEFRTINGVAARIIALYSRMYGRTPPELIRNESETTPLLMRLWQDTNHEYPAESTVKDLRTAITYIKNMALTDEEIEGLETDLASLPELYRRYQAALKRAGQMDYDDQMVFALQILRAAPQVLAYFQQRYKYFCVDESQDTSKIQHEIIRLLAGRSLNLFMVGDEDQSIYGFRAAYPQALMDFEKTYPGAQILLMEQNYRSTEPILEAANRFVARNRYRRPKTIAPTQGPGAPLQIVTVPRRADQLPFLFETAQHCDTGTAVLFRNHESALPIIDLCERRGIPYACKAVDQTFFTNKIVRDVTDIFTLAAHPADGEAFLRCYYKFGVPVMGVRGAAVATIISQAVSAAWVLRFLTGKQTVLRLKRAYFRIDRPVLASAVGLGASPFVMQSTESLLTIAFNVSLQKYGGDAAVGAMTILTSVAQMVQLPLTGLAQGAQPILSYACGAKRPDRMKRVVQLNLAAAFVFAFSIWAAVQLFPHTVVHLFTSDEELVERTVWALRVYFALGFTNAFQTGFQQSFVALGEARISLFLALERKVFLLIPFILLLPHFFADKLFAVFLAEPVADLLAAATTTTLFLLRFRQITRDM